MTKDIVSKINYARWGDNAHNHRRISDRDIIWYKIAAKEKYSPVLPDNIYGLSTYNNIVNNLDSPTIQIITNAYNHETNPDEKYTLLVMLKIARIDKAISNYNDLLRSASLLKRSQCLTVKCSIVKLFIKLINLFTNKERRYNG